MSECMRPRYKYFYLSVGQTVRCLAVHGGIWWCDGGVGGGASAEISW